MSQIDNTEQLIQKFSPLVDSLTMTELQVLNKLLVERVRILNKAGTLMSMAQFRPGDRVIWSGSDGSMRSGIIFKLNHKTASIKVSDGGTWNVSPELLSKDKG